MTAGFDLTEAVVEGPARNVNPARAIAWLASVTIYCTIFNRNNLPPPRQFFTRQNTFI